MSEISRNWPALMDLRTAGDYLTLSRGSLIGLLLREQISPILVGARLKRWRRQDLDALVERLAVSPTAALSTAPGAAEDEAGRALAAVERRSARRRPSRRSREVRQSHSAA